MESLLALSFDNISSRDTTRIKKGLRQIEGLLAQICLVGSRSKGGHKRQQSISTQDQDTTPRSLEQVATDPAFREFFRLQEGFDGNGVYCRIVIGTRPSLTQPVASRLIGCLERVLGMPSSKYLDRKPAKQRLTCPDDSNNMLISSILDLLQGVLLLHPPSRTLFRQEIYMNVLLDLLDVANPSIIQSQALLVLVSSLLAAPENTRTFETLDGLWTVASLFKSRSTAKEVKMKVVEFFYFYLMPEATSKAVKGHQRAPSKRVGSGDREGKQSATRSTQEKQQMLGKYMSNVAELVQDLQESVPFPIAA